MKDHLLNLVKIFLVLIFVSSNFYKASAEEEDSILELLQVLQNDIKTLEKAVYSQGSNDSGTLELSSGGNDVLTKHLLKLSDLEEQFKILTNNFEKINFKLDKLSSRITKVQKDNQMRFQDLEISDTANLKKKLPGSDQAKDLGETLQIQVNNSNVGDETQETQSIESVGTVVTETTERAEKILPDGSPEKQYEFAVSFIKVGDYETAELALREFVDNNSQHNLAGNAQYWYGETFRVRQLYQDAATAYLDGYKKYPKSSKAPVNLLKLGVMLVQIGEKEQGCSMILGIKDQYPKANQSVIQKAEYEKKKFNCQKKS
ncbi:tol-pal system protein YbgF [Pelagibacteraceae bacterium]|jgi:tol-pal system protein YbgF|nr:tol-pal system protein YbgF [Pelagibacteraceae bacterium]